MRISGEARAIGLHLGKKYGGCGNIIGNIPNAKRDTIETVIQYTLDTVQKDLNTLARKQKAARNKKNAEIRAARKAEAPSRELTPIADAVMKDVAEKRRVTSPVTGSR